MKIRVSADSTCDLSQDIVDRFNIVITPLVIIHGENSYKDGIDITSEDVFRMTDESGELCSTSAINTYDYSESFRKSLEGYDALVHITISSEMSACYRNACIAAKEEDLDGKVLVIDSRNLSTGMGHVVYEAALMAQKGVDLATMETELNELTGRVEASFVLDQLEYMKKGGRCSSVKAFGAAVLKLKPSIIVENGAMTVGETYCGSIEKCMKRYIKDKLDGRTDIEGDRVFITYSSTTPQLLSSVRKMLKEYNLFDEIIETHAGSTVTCHCGPMTMGILFKRKK